jgi:hypothetical protein
MEMSINDQNISIWERIFKRKQLFNGIGKADEKINFTSSTTTRTPNVFDL